MDKLYNLSDTIAALATPIGIGGISVIRISGNKTFTFIASIFHGNRNIKEVPSHTIHYGKIIVPETESFLDTVLVSIFKKPHSYTGEDVIEISSHGGYYVAQKILTLLYSLGIRPAQPGEFTLRAFLNGKLDLSQAEAVADIINSKTENAYRTSLEQLHGKLSNQINSLREQIVDLCSLFELELDFSQEGFILADKDQSRNKIETIEQIIKQLIISYISGKLVREGVKVALVGRPNSGKSSLLNLLLGEDRAIVSNIPGTTRDIIEESIVLNGVEFVFTDTAGLRDAFDIIEKEGIRRAKKILRLTDVVLLLIDTSEPQSDEDMRHNKMVIESLGENTNVLYVLNKIDIRHQHFITNQMPENNVIEISCLTHKGINELKNKLTELSIPSFDSNMRSLTITNVRHKENLERALKSLGDAKNSLINNFSGEFIAVDLRAALNYLGEIIGLTTPEDILNNIFSHFCIGK